MTEDDQSRTKPKVRIDLKRDTVTLVDRLVHRSEILEIEGNSYRLKEAKERAAMKTASRRGKKSAA